MNMTEALEALDHEQLKANHRHTSRTTYRGWVRDYCVLLKSGTVSNFQEFRRPA